LGQPRLAGLVPRLVGEQVVEEEVTVLAPEFEDAAVRLVEQRRTLRMAAYSAWGSPKVLTISSAS
jgi:hypothetical protein